jgi:hypothetical protein
MGAVQGGKKLFECSEAEPSSHLRHHHSHPRKVLEGGEVSSALSFGCARRLIDIRMLGCTRMSVPMVPGKARYNPAVDGVPNKEIMIAAPRLQSLLFVVFRVLQVRL